MADAARVSDMGKVDADKHGCPACPHKAIGPAIQGSPNVNINSLPAIREGDKGFHAVCCGPNMWTATAGSGSVFINGKAAHRKGDAQEHCGGSGKMDGGSSNVNIGG
jgi:uncharacterized Zn-binding protein involved in type VI secretion